MHTHKYWNN